MRLTISLLLLLFSCQSMSAGLVAEGLWVRPTLPGAPNGVGYGTLTNQSEAPIEITGLTTAAARVAQIHETFLENDMMRMRRIDPVTLEPGEKIVLQPGGKHFMLIGITEPLKPQDSVVLQLELSDGEQVELELPVVEHGDTGP